MLLWKCIFNTWARSGAACPNNLLTGQHFHSRHCRVEDSQATEYFIFTWWTRFCMNYTKRINQEQSGLGSQLCLEICSVRHFISEVLSSIFQRWGIDFSFPLYFVLPDLIGLGFYSVSYEYQQSVVPCSVSTSKQNHNKMPIITMGGVFAILGFFLAFACVLIILHSKSVLYLTVNLQSFSLLVLL